MKTRLLLFVAAATGLLVLVLGYCYFSGRLRFLTLNIHARIELNGAPVQGEILVGQGSALVTTREPGKAHSYQLFFEGDTDFTEDMGFVVDCSPWVAPHLPVLPQTRNYPPCTSFRDSVSRTKRWPLMDEGKSMRFALRDQSIVRIRRNSEYSLASACAVTLPQTAAVAQGQQPVHHNFKEVATGKAIPTTGATAASVHSYESEDRTAVVQLREWYKSASDARSGLDTVAMKASRVTKQSTNKDEKGRVVGKRVELVFSHGDRVSPKMVIAWTDGATVVELSSTSLPLLLDFESQYYPVNSDITRK